MTSTNDLRKVIASARAKAEYMRLQGMYRAQEEWEEFADHLAAIQAPIVTDDGNLRKVVFEHIADLRRCADAARQHTLGKLSDEFELAAVELEAALAAPENTP